MQDLSLIGNQRNNTSEINSPYILWYVMCAFACGRNNHSGPPGHILVPVQPWSLYSRNKLFHYLQTPAGSKRKLLFD